MNVLQPRPNISRVAVIIPCYNESEAIASVVRGFSGTLPGAEIHVFDNNSSDGTAGIARAAGATVHRAALQGKGHVVRRMFADVEADLYVLVDGDGTYDPAAAPGIIAALTTDALDMVNAARIHQDSGAYRRGHVTGNLMLTGLVGLIFGNRLTDMLSGYRGFSRRFVKSFPALSSGFEIETELTVHALSLRMPIGEIPTRYGARPEGSASKLRTYRDGIRILRTILVLVKQEKPLALFSVTGGILLVLALLFGVPIIVEYARTGLVPRLPTAVLSMGLVLLACLSFVCGLILDNVTRGRLEARHMAYLTIPGPEHTQLRWGSTPNPARACGPGPA